MAVARVINRGMRRVRYRLTGEREFTVRYMVDTDTATDGPKSVYESGQIPRIGDEYLFATDHDTGAVAVGVEVDEHPDRATTWNVSVDFSTIRQSVQDLRNRSDPLEEEPTISIRTSTIDKPTLGSVRRVNADGSLNKATWTIMNSAGEPFPNPYMRKQAGQVITITRNELRLNLLQMRDYQDVLNDAPFATYPIRSLKLSITQADEQISRGVRFWRKTYELEYDPIGFTLEIRDEGTYKKIGAVITKFDDGVGNTPVTKLLNGSGDELAFDADPVFLYFVFYPDASFSGLNLPEDLLLNA